MAKSKKGKSQPEPVAQSLQRTKSDDALLVQRDNRRAVLRMNAFVREYEKQCGNISATCAITGVSRRTYYRWMHGDASVHRRFQRKILRILPGERLVDAAESVILYHLNDKDLTAAIFTAKTKGRSRGWNERLDSVTELNSSSDQLVQLRNAIDRRARLKGIPFQEELQNYLDLFGKEIRPEIKESLVSELEQ